VGRTSDTISAPHGLIVDVRSEIQPFVPRRFSRITIGPTTLRLRGFYDLQVLRMLLVGREWPLGRGAGLRRTAVRLEMRAHSMYLLRPRVARGFQADVTSCTVASGIA